MISNLLIQEKTLDEAWQDWYDIITSNISEDTSRDGNVVGEVINAITVIQDPTRCIMKNPIRKLPMRYCIGELLWYLSGNNKLNAIRLYTSAWDRMSDDGETVNSNYGYMLRYKYGFDQLQMCEDILRNDPNSRQAVINIKPPIDLRENSTHDLQCTICLQFLVRENKLYMTTYMRSNDLWMGFPNDVFQFTCMQIYLAMRLGLDLGTYTHIAGSLHLYERDFEKAKENENEVKSN